MIIYENTKGGFVSDVRDNLIATKIKQEFKNHNISHSNDAEYRAWSNSMQYMRNVIDDNDISDDCMIAIEYQIPLTSKRVDFLLTGMDETNANNIVVVELKQWENSTPTQREDLVEAFTGGANRVVCHPSYQAYSYAKIIETFNEDVYKRDISFSYELIIWASKGYKHTFNYDEMFKINDEELQDVWTIPAVGMSEKKFGYHPTQKPEALLERIILACSNKGDIVLDPFSGSGTTCYVAKKLNRNYVGIEKNEEYFNISKKRIDSI